MVLCISANYVLTGIINPSLTPTMKPSTLPAYWTNHTYRIDSIQVLFKSATLEKSMLKHHNFSAYLQVYPHDDRFKIQTPFVAPSNDHVVVWNYKTSLRIYPINSDDDEHKNEISFIKIFFYLDQNNEHIYGTHRIELDPLFARHLKNPPANTGKHDGELINFVEKHIQFDERFPIVTYDTDTVVAHIYATILIDYTIHI